MAEGSLPSAGVQNLIDRLRDEGIQAGQAEAARILEAARAEAASIIESAHNEAREVQAAAQRNQDLERRRAESALQLARRDALLRLRGEIERNVLARLRELALAVVADPSSMRQLASDALRAVIARHPDARAVEVLANESTEPFVQSLVRALASEVAAQGVVVTLAGGRSQRLVLRIASLEAEASLDDAVLAELLAAHVLPGFRNLLEGRDGVAANGGTGGDHDP